jgi:hypothetical protein
LYAWQGLTVLTTGLPSPKFHCVVAVFKQEGPAPASVVLLKQTFWPTQKELAFTTKADCAFFKIWMPPAE